jgi:hypothetical protein
MRKLRRLPTLFPLLFLPLALCAALHAPARAQSNAGKAAATTPAQGSPERKAVLDAVRARLKLTSQFKVYHLKLSGGWAYFHGGEVVDAGEGELQETDLDVKALLERKTSGGKTSWVVAEIWTLPTDDKLSYKSFVTRARKRQKAARVPADIFPSDM